MTTKENSSNKQNILVIPSIILTFIAPVVGLLLGAVALKQIKKTNEDGRNIALVSVILSSIFSVVQVIFFVAIIVALITGDTSNTQTIEPSDNQPKAEQKAVTPKPNKPQYIYDVPSLVGKNIDQVRVVLGSTTSASPEPNVNQQDFDVWDNEFQKDGRPFLVTFNPQTRQVIDFFISTNDSSGKTRDKEELLGVGNLSKSASDYDLEFVTTIQDESYYTGVKIIPKS